MLTSFKGGGGGLLLPANLLKFADENSPTMETVAPTPLLKDMLV